MTIKWDDGRTTRRATDSVTLVYGMPHYLGGNAHYRNGDIIAPDGNATTL